MDKYSVEELRKAATGIVKDAHLGHLNDTPMDELQMTMYLGKKKHPLPPNIMVFQKFCTDMAKNATPSGCKLFFYLMSISGYENYISMDVHEISEAIGYKKRMTISALNELTDLGIIIKLPHPSDKRRNDYFINPMAAWKGHSYSRQNKLKLMKKVDPAQLDMFGKDEFGKPILLQDAKTITDGE